MRQYPSVQHVPHLWQCPQTWKELIVHMPHLTSVLLCWCCCWFDVAVVLCVNIIVVVPWMSACAGPKTAISSSALCAASVPSSSHRHTITNHNNIGRHFEKEISNHMDETTIIYCQVFLISQGLITNTFLFSLLLRRRLLLLLCMFFYHFYIQCLLGVYMSGHTSSS